MFRSYLTAMLIVALLPLAVKAQETQQGEAQAKQWTLRECINYALENNISVQQMRLKVESSDVNLNTLRNSRLPDLNASVSETATFGKVEDINGKFQSQTNLGTTVGIGTSIPVFQGMRIKHQIAEGRSDLQVAMLELDKVRDNVELNVTALYLQVLMDKELVVTAKYQLKLSGDRVERSSQLVRSGSSPESELYESEALLAKDELTLVKAQNSLAASKLKLCLALNMDDVRAFDVLEPEFDNGVCMVNMEEISNIADVYAYALEERPGLKAERARLDSYKSSLKVAKSYRFPQISLSAGYNNAYNYTFDMTNAAFGTQFKNNGSEYVGFKIDIPIFNRNATRNRIRQAGLSIRSQHLEVENVERELRNEIETTYNDAIAARKQFYTAEKSLSAATKAFAYEHEKAKFGKSTVFDYNDAKTRVEKAQSEMTQAKYEYIFRCKILQFYMGKPLEL